MSKRNSSFLVPLMLAVGALAVYTIHRPALFPSEDLKYQNQINSHECIKLVLVVTQTHN